MLETYLCRTKTQVMKNLAESELIDGIRLGREDVFAVFFNNYWESLFREAFFRLKSHDEAQDIVQDIFTDLWQRRQSLVIDTSIAAYLQGALKFSIIRHISRSRLHQSVVDHLLHQMSVFEDSILDVIAAGEIQRTLEESISAFPENMRQIFALRTQDFTISEIAEALELSVQTVKNNNSEALKRLKHVLAEQHPEISSSMYALLLLFIKS